MQPTFQIGELARRAALSIDAIRSYERRKLLPPAFPSVWNRSAINNKFASSDCRSPIGRKKRDKLCDFYGKFWDMLSLTSF